FQAEDGIRDGHVTGVQTCALPILLVLTLLLSFTGYLLPDDQLGFWAVTVGTNMARATPLLGHAGPFGAQLGMTPFNDVRFGLLRSEERRVGKEGGSGRAAGQWM